MVTFVVEYLDPRLSSMDGYRLRELQPYVVPTEFIWGLGKRVFVIPAAWSKKSFNERAQHR